MSSQLDLTKIETRIFQMIDKDMTLFEDSKGTIKRVMQYNPISRVYVVVTYDTVKEENDVLCITRKPSVAAKAYNSAF